VRRSRDLGIGVGHAGSGEGRAHTEGDSTGGQPQIKDWLMTRAMIVHTGFPKLATQSRAEFIGSTGKCQLGAV